MSHVALALASLWLTRGVLQLLRRSPKGWSTALIAVVGTTVPWAIRWRAFLLGPPETDALSNMVPLFDLFALWTCAGVLSAIALSPLFQEGPARQAAVLDGVLGGLGLVLAGLTRRWEFGLVFGTYAAVYLHSLYALVRHTPSLRVETYRSTETRRRTSWPLFVGVPWTERDPSGVQTNGSWL